MGSSDDGENDDKKDNVRLVVRPAVGMTVFITVGWYPAKLRTFIILFNPYTMPAKQGLGTSF